MIGLLFDIIQLREAKTAEVPSSHSEALQSFAVYTSWLELSLVNHGMGCRAFKPTQQLCALLSVVLTALIHTLRAGPHVLHVTSGTYSIMTVLHMPMGVPLCASAAAVTHLVKPEKQLEG